MSCPGHTMTIDACWSILSCWNRAATGTKDCENRGIERVTKYLFLEFFQFISYSKPTLILDSIRLH